MFSFVRDQHVTCLFVSRDIVQDCIDMCEQGLISPHISEVFPLKEINEAMDYMRARKSSGKVVVEIDD